MLSQLISSLSGSFRLKDLGRLSYFLGIQAQFSAQGLHLCQHKYISDLLFRAGMFDCKPIATPMVFGISLSLHDGDPLFNPIDYWSVVGALQYCTITRPDIFFAVNKVCQFLHAPTTVHWLAVKRILRYLKGTMTHGLQLTDSHLTLSCFTDVDWVSCPDGRLSTSGYCTYLGTNLVSWSSSKQKTVSRSSAESEYRGLANATSELMWVSAMLT